MLLYLGVGVFRGTGCYCTWEWVFSVLLFQGLGDTVPGTLYYCTWDWMLLYLGLGVTVPGSGCFLCYCTRDWVTMYLGLGITVPGTAAYSTRDWVLLYLGLGVFCGSGAYSVCITPCWKLRFVALLIGIGGRLADDDVGSFCCFLLVPGLPSVKGNSI